MKRLFHIVAFALTTLVIILAGLVVCLKLKSVHQLVISRVNSAIPGTITLGGLSFSLLDMRMEIRNIVLADSLGKPLVGFNRLAVNISTLNLLIGRLVVQEAVLDQPWVVLDVDSGGQLSLLDALPPFPAKPPGTVAKKPDSTQKPFRIEMRNLNISGGRILFTAQHDSLRMQAYGLSVSGKAKTIPLLADIGIGLDSAAMQTNGANLHINKMSMMARIRNEDLDTISLLLHTDHSTIALNGRISSLTNDPLVSLIATADLALSEIGSMAGLKETLSGRSRLEMNLSGKAANPDLDLEVSCDGSSVGEYHVESLLLKAHLSDRVLRLSSLSIKAGGGSIDMVGGVDVKEMFPGGFLAPAGSLEQVSYNLTLSGKDISLREAAPLQSGTAAISMTIEGQGADPHSLAAKLSLSASVAALQLDSTSLPLDGTLGCAATIGDGIIQTNCVTAHLGNTSASLCGSYTIASEVMDAALDLSAPSLDELLGFAGIDSASGSLKIAARVGGNLKHPVAAIDLEADTVRFAEARIGKIKIVGGLNKNGTATLSELTLTSGNSHLQLTGSAQVLNNGIPIPTHLMDFDLSLLSHDLAIGDFIDSLEGTLDVDIALKGRVDDLVGHVRVALSDLLVAGWKANHIGLDARLENRRVSIEPLRITLRKGQELTLAGWTSLKDSFDLSIGTSGIQMHGLAPLAALDSLDGLITMNLRAKGTFSKPMAEGNLGISGIRFGAASVDDIALRLDMHKQQIDVSGTLGGAIQAGYNLDTKDFSAGLSFDSLRLGPYLGIVGQNLDGVLAAEAQVSGNVSSLADMSATLHVSSLTLSYKDSLVIATHELNASLVKNRYTIPDFNLTLADEGSLNGRAHGFTKGPHDIALSGTIPLTIARHFVPDLPDIEGSLGIDASITGAATSPELRATVEVKNIGMTLPGLSHRLHSMNGRIVADQNAVRIESLHGNLGEGAFSVSGKMELEKLIPSAITTEITLNNVPVGVPDVLDLVLNAKLRFEGTPDTTLLAGDIVLLDGVYYQDVVIDPFAGMRKRKRKVAAAPAENTTPFLKGMRFDISVQARSPVRVDNNIAQLAITPDIQLMGSLQAPALSGRAQVEQGTITYQKKVFTVERGIIDFVNPYAIEPTVDIQGKIPVRNWMIQILITGTPNDLVFRLTCDDPILDDQDILSLLLFGKTTAELQNNPLSGGVEQSNQQMLASLIASTFGDNLKKGSGLDLLEVRTGDEHNDASDRITLTLGKQVTKRLGTKYSVESEGGEIVQRATAEYRMLQNLRIAGFQDTKGVYGGELHITWERR